jgi:hypothetical protein
MMKKPSKKMVERLNAIEDMRYWLKSLGQAEPSKSTQLVMQPVEDYTLIKAWLKDTEKALDEVSRLRRLLADGAWEYFFTCRMNDVRVYKQMKLARKTFLSCISSRPKGIKIEIINLDKEEEKEDEKTD